MATLGTSRFRRGKARARDGGEERVGEMLSDSSDDDRPLGMETREKMRSTSRFNGSSLRSSSSSEFREGGGAVVPRATKATASVRSGGCEKKEGQEGDDEDKKKGRSVKTTAKDEKKPEKTKKKPLNRARSSRTTSSMRRSTGKKWYSDSDEEDPSVASKKKPAKEEVKSDEDVDSDLDAYIAGSMLGQNSARGEASGPANQSRAALKKRTNRAESSGNNSDESGEILTPVAESQAPPEIKKKTNLMKIMAKTRVLSPFGKSKGFGAEAPEYTATDSPAAKTIVKNSTPVSEHSSFESLPTGRQSSGTGNAVSAPPSEVMTASVPAIIVNRRTDRLKHSVSGSEYSASPRLAINNDEVLSPGLRKLPGASAGRPGSGVLLEGWLRQKQRRGIKGLKKWNSRYFVLYARSNEIRYYADVVQSAWGPIPLGEIGAISLRLIQRTGKRSHPKYKGCRFDITCRNTWGTHYADDYVSSDEETGTSNANGSNMNNEKEASAKAATPAKQPYEKNGTPRSSRIYSLIADSPQVTSAWLSMLDSLLVRSANSPRPDTSALDTESLVLLGPEESVPKAIVYAINFIFDSTPGIETERFYEVDPDATKLRAALKFLNQFAGEASERRPTKDGLDELLDAVTAGAVVQLWLKQLEQPVIPFSMYEDFRTLAREAQTAPFDLRRNLRALLESLPQKNLTMLACLLFHLNDVNVYSSKNEMNAGRLAQRFANWILRPPSRSPQSTQSDADSSAICSLIEEMITNVDSFIDEKEAQLLEDNRL
ncbi:ferric/cupric-chelate reductase [Phytophthora boehmeriae]|uniref:Ferric/cupric-chelate reductase n=1 Tax=Phytophthora boehmeriae TaxID=109152 RepID=A0A8T1WUE8_9STRA|nr:ferric/cupric-chelate reductase [Phytophthora boehmeriae]